VSGGEKPQEIDELRLKKKNNYINMAVKFKKNSNFAKKW